MKETVIKPYNDAENIMRSAVEAYINRSVSTGFRILGSERNGAFRETDNVVNAGIDFARNGDVNTMIRFGIPLVHSGGAWLGIKTVWRNGGGAYCMRVDSARWKYDARGRYYCDLSYV